MPDFVLAFCTYKFLNNFVFMISPYQFRKEQFNFVYMQDSPKLCCRTTFVIVFPYANYGGGEIGNEFVS